MSIKLTDTQLVVLTAAVQREDRCLAIPNSLKGGSAQKVASKLLAEGLVREIKAKPGAPVWGRNEETQHAYALKLTAAGMKAITVDDKADTLAASNPAPAQSNLETDESDDLSVPGTAIVLTQAPRAGTKMARVIGMLQRDQGATLADLIAATGWLPHTTRAALTGLRKRGYIVALDRSNERESTYGIPRGCSLTGEKPNATAIEPPPAPAARSARVVRSRKPESVAPDAAVAAA